MYFRKIPYLSCLVSSPETQNAIRLINERPHFPARGYEVPAHTQARIDSLIEFLRELRRGWAICADLYQKEARGRPELEGTIDVLR
ncbi:hypothetical protein BRD56_00590 [Thermoplasmatales archaeon SW_10_69_26]|nr:MAG: hypothetical protein BRD56_00590 [Thermoplasmatales archaeon SW_10_69_26]